MNQDSENINVCENCKYVQRTSCDKFKCRLKGFFFLTRYVSGTDTCKYFSMVKNINKKQVWCARHECKVATSVRSVLCPCTTCNADNCHVCAVADKQILDSVDSKIQGIQSACQMCQGIKVKQNKSIFKTR